MQLYSYDRPFLYLFLLIPSQKAFLIFFFPNYMPLLLLRYRPAFKLVAFLNHFFITKKLSIIK